MKAGMHADLKNKSSFLWVGEGKLPRRWNILGALCGQVSRLTACGNAIFWDIEHCLVALLMDMSVRCLPPRGAHEFHLDGNQDPKLCLYLLKYPTDPFWTFLQVPNLQHQEETRAFLSIVPQPSHSWSHLVLPPLDQENYHPETTHSLTVFHIFSTEFMSGRGRESVKNQPPCIGCLHLSHIITPCFVTTVGHSGLSACLQAAILSPFQKLHVALTFPSLHCTSPSCWSTSCPQWLRQKNSLILSPLFCKWYYPPRLYTYKSCCVHLPWICELLPQSLVKSSVSWPSFLKKNSSTDPAPEAGWSVLHYATTGSFKPQAPSPSERCHSCFCTLLHLEQHTVTCLRRENCPTTLGWVTHCYGGTTKTLQQQLLLLYLPPWTVWGPVW